MRPLLVVTFCDLTLTLINDNLYKMRTSPTPLGVPISAERGEYWRELAGVDLVVLRSKIPTQAWSFFYAWRVKEMCRCLARLSATGPYSHIMLIVVTCSAASEASVRAPAGICRWRHDVGRGGGGARRNCDLDLRRHRRATCCRHRVAAERPPSGGRWVSLTK